MKNKERTLFIVLFLLWFVIALLTGINHEPWADEAQSWLIARDNSYFDIVFKILKYEGHPALFYFILRFLHQLHFPYEAIFLVPLIFTSMGVFLLLFKTKLPTLIKVSFVFGYFIIYQYAIVARSYSLFLPLLMFIGLIYKERLIRIGSYSLLLIMLMSISAYSYITALVLFLFYIFDIFKMKLFTGKSCSFILITIMFFILTAFYIYTPSDCTSSEPFYFTLSKLYSVLTGAFFDEGVRINIIQLLCIPALYLSAMLLFCKTIRQTIFFICLNFSLILGLTFSVCRCWHYGHILIMLIFTLSILCSENNLDNTSQKIKYFFYTVFIYISIIQIIWSIKAIVSDVNNEYSPAKTIYKFITNNGFDRFDMIGLGYKSVSLQPYFKHNVYSNYKTSHFMFSSDFFKYSDEHVLNLTPIIIYDYSWYKRYENIQNKLDDEYYIYPFFNNFCCKNNTNKQLDLYILIKKDLFNKD